jgi:hypothetical protein
MISVEVFRECAAALYSREIGSSCRSATGSRLNHSRKATSALVEGRAFLKARGSARRNSGGVRAGVDRRGPRGTHSKGDGARARSRLKARSGQRRSAGDPVEKSTICKLGSSQRRPLTVWPLGSCQRTALSSKNQAIGPK